MSDKRKNDDFYGSKTTFNPITALYRRHQHYQFYVDATPYAVIMHLHQLEKDSRAGLTYRINTSSVKTGHTFERFVSKLNGGSRTVVTGEILPYDPETNRTFVIVRVVLINSFFAAAIMFIGGVSIFLSLIMLASSSVLGSLLGFITFPALTLVPMSFFVPERRKALNIVASHLAKLRA